ncbi:MAG TPA: hypothetical protein VF183_00105 [Acidimicrobiales bacterium]
MSTDQPAIDLLAFADTVRRAAAARDLVQLHRELSRLRTALVHLLHRQHELHPVARTTTASTRDSWRQLLALLDELLFSDDGDPSGCACLARAGDVERALRAQANVDNSLASTAGPLGSSIISSCHWR